MKRLDKSAYVSPKIRALLLIAAATLILTVVLVRRFGVRNIASVDPTISIDRRQNDTASQPSTTRSPANLPDDGEVYRTADRLREASALTVAAVLFAAEDRLSRKHIHDAAALVGGIGSAGLLPPDIVSDGAAAMLHSDHSHLLLRFRPEPLAVEVLSFPLSREDGPALMVRIPALGGDCHGSVFIADRLGDIDTPAPFASVVDWVSAGWIDQSFDQAQLPEAHQQQLRNGLAARHSK